VGQIAAVIDMSMAEEDGFDAMRLKGKDFVAPGRLGPALEIQTAIQQDLSAIGRDQGHRPSHFAGATAASHARLNRIACPIACHEHHCNVWPANALRRLTGRRQRRRCSNLAAYLSNNTM